MSDQNNRFKLEDDAASAATPKTDFPAADIGADDILSGAGSADEMEEDGSGGRSPEDFERDKTRLIDFYQYPREKRRMVEFLEDTYRAYEKDDVDRIINRVVHEHQCELQGANSYHKPGHIGPLLYEYLNMVGVEHAFVSGLQHTKSSLTKTIQHRVEEINTLLRGVGGFNRQLKASFSRSAVVYLEQEDPRNTHREKIVFTVNLGDFELRYPMDEENGGGQITADGRTVRRLCWDEAINTLAEVVSNTGLKPKYVKNDKNSCAFTMRQMLLSRYEEEPDEYFAFDLRHVNEEMRQKLIESYVEELSQFDESINRSRRRLRSWWPRSQQQRDKIKHELELHVSDRAFYVGTHPDPREMDSGLVFQISANTLKDYGITKDKMQVIMTKYILALSKIAVDKSMDQQVNTVFQRKQGKAYNFQTLQEQDAFTGDKAQPGRPKQAAGMRGGGGWK